MRQAATPGHVSALRVHDASSAWRSSNLAARARQHPAPQFLLEVGYHITLVYGVEDAEKRGAPQRAPARTQGHSFRCVHERRALEEQHRHEMQRTVYWQRPPENGEKAVDRTECTTGNVRMRSCAWTIWRLRRTPEVEHGDVCWVYVLGVADGSAEEVLSW